MAESTDSPSLRTGSCLCEAVKYSIKGPETIAYLCHCRNCQKLSGSAFCSNQFYMRSNFEVTQGEDMLSVYKCTVTGSGNLTKRHFCSNCGSALFILPDAKPEIVVVVGGSLDDFETAFKPMQEVFVKDRRSWVTPLEGAEMFQRARPPTSGQK